jgi:hypothetical protein
MIYTSRHRVRDAVTASVTCDVLVTEVEYSTT